ncbi:dynamin family protein [Romboutsia sp.]|uniref:dynamin family protein n=1 Tax=Romboutsia sp. TaxID=1965302 RepID=UPI002CE3725D|nr:dynamin family protein [Romboutsia sp.]HSQ87456.1 dynamin family protein [Romboutsia sp.]
MENNKKYIYEIKEMLLNSPLRQRLVEENTIPFKDIILKQLGDIIQGLNVLESNKDNPIKIVIVGEVKCGKSSLVNALIGNEVSEVDVLEATSNIIEVIYGKESYIKKNEDITQVRLNIDYLKKINIVDTPGLKSITMKNEQKTLNYIQNADLILFVIDATHLGQEDIVDALDVICEYKKPIIGVINKCDLLNDNKEETLDYIKQEYGIYIDEFFMISSYLEYQDKLSSRAKAKNTDLVISNYTDLRENFNMLNKYIQNVYENCETVKIDSMKSSVEGVIHKDIINHYDYLKRLSMIIDEFNKYEKALQNKFDYIYSKMDFEINDWLNRIFFNEEMKKIKNNIENAKIYINENYINDYINKKKIELDNLFFKEWSECLKEISDDMNDDIKKYVKDITYKNEFLSTPNFKVDGEKPNINDMLAVVGTGAVLGITSGGVVSIYSAAIGTSAASVTIGTAMMTYCPPLLIAGTISGALGKAIYDKVKSDQKNKEILKDVDEFMETIKYKMLEELKIGYNNCSKEIVFTTLEILKNIKGVSMGKYEMEILVKDIENYIQGLECCISK